MKRIVFSVVIVVVLLSCIEKETPGGVKFSVLKKGDGNEIATGKMILVNMVIHNQKDSMVFSTYDEGSLPLVLPMPDGSMANDNGEYGVLKMMTKGDCVTFRLPAKTVYSKRRSAVPKNIDPLSQFTFIVQIKDVWTIEQAQKYESEEIAKMQLKQLRTDSILIAEYLKAHIAKVSSTKSGLRYIVHKEGKGEFAKVGNTAYIHYAGFFLNGKIFDTSMAKIAKENDFDNGARNEPYPVPVGTGQVIQGWDEIIQLMNRGTKLTVYIPSGLAYGFSGRPGIPSNTVLRFDMELVDFK